MSSAFDFFLLIENDLNRYSTGDNVYTLTETQKENILNLQLDYNIFRNQFDLTCRFICLFSRLERFRYSKVHIFLVKYIIILSSFLKNRTSTKISPASEAFLAMATQNIVNDFRINLSILPDYVTVKMYDCAKLLMAFALINIHEVVGISKNTPRNGSAYFFLCNEDDLNSVEGALFNYSLNFPDFLELGTAMDETRDSRAFKKYSQQPRPHYKRAMETSKLISYGTYFALGFFILCVALEYIITTYL